jgi:DNA-binding response OmpR family regulator
MARIFLVEDDLSLAQNVIEWLRHHEHGVEHVANGTDAAARLATDRDAFEIVVLDWELPGLSGPDVLRQFRSTGGVTPVLMLTGRQKIADKEVGYDSGADEYLTKPFDLRELSLRISAILKRTSAKAPSHRLRHGTLILDTMCHEVKVNDEPVVLQPKEFDVLEFLLRNKNKPFSTEALMNRVWVSEPVTAAAVNTCVSRLRKKLADCGMDKCIDTAHGVGYLIRDQQ